MLNYSGGLCLQGRNPIDITDKFKKERILRLRMRKEKTTKIKIVIIFVILQLVLLFFGIKTYSHMMQSSYCHDDFVEDYIDAIEEGESLFCEEFNVREYHTWKWGSSCVYSKIVFEDRNISTQDLFKGRVLTKNQCDQYFNNN